MGKGKNNPGVLIWDLGFTLIEPTCSRVAEDLGNDVCQQLTELYGAFSQRALNNIFRAVFGQKPLSESHVGPLAPIVHDWFAGTVSATEVLRVALKKARVHKHFDEQQKALFMAVMTWFFTPHLLAKSIRPLPEMVKLLHACAQRTSELYVLSNWDKESFWQIYRNPQFQSIFTCFKLDNMYVSGLVGHVKPDLDAYRYLLARTGLAPGQCIFIDDQENNVAAARECGMRAIHFKQNDVNAVRSQLTEWQVLNNEAYTIFI